jgi:hypothetical protein
MMDKVGKPSNSECYTSLSEPFRIYQQIAFFIKSNTEILDFISSKHEGGKERNRTEVSEKLYFKGKHEFFTMKIFIQFLIALLKKAGWREGKGVEI